MAPCDRCARVVLTRFECLGRNLCFDCLSIVRKLTSGYAVLGAIASADMDQALEEARRKPPALEEKRAPR